MGKALGSTPFGEGIDVKKVNAHTVFLPTWLNLVSRKATDALRPKYGKLYGYDFATPRTPR